MPGTERVVKILACRQVYTGRNPRGDQYTIYEVDAANQNGAVINEKLRSFEPMPIGQTVEVTVTPFDSEQYGRSYTLHLKSASRKNTPELLNELQAEVQALTQRLNQVEATLSQLTATAPTASGGPSDTPGW